MCIIIVMTGLLYRFWKKSLQLFTQKIPHTVLSIVLFGNGSCITFELLKTGIPILNLRLATPDGPHGLVKPTMALMSTDQHILTLPRQILSSLNEIQMVLSTPDDYTHVHTCFSPTVGLKIRPTVSDPQTNISDALPQEHPENN